VTRIAKLESMATRTLLTIDDFERLPDEVAKNKELVDGELVDVSGNTPRHNLLRDYLLTAIRRWVQEKHLGTVISEQEYQFLDNAHGPDVSFFGPSKKALLDLDKRVQRFVPDLAIEIPSPNDTYFSILRKKDRYLSAGTLEVWLISPEAREIAVYTQAAVRLYRSSDIISTDLLPGWTLSLDELFREL
jgi:Uma2 family endonuclease